MNELDKRLQVAREAALAAGDLLMSLYGRLASFDRKSAVDLVTEADRRSEVLLRDALLGAFPGDAYLGEEGAFDVGGSGWRWIVDPLDGTTNFVHTHPLFAVSIGLELDGRGVGGCVWLPYYREMFHAGDGTGAFRNGEPIHVSRTARLDDALLATGFPYNRREIADELLAKVRVALVEAQGFRRSGSAAIDLCAVAAGRIDGFWEQGLHPWDLAAGEVLVREAGGRFTGWDGAEHQLAGGRTLASNGLIHDELRGALFGL